MKIKVILADDHSIVRDGIKAIIEKKGENIEIIGEAVNGNEVLKIAKKNPADIYILDISMPLLNGIETTCQLIKGNPESKVIILSMHDDRSYVEKALQSGAKGYILKETATDEIISAIRSVHMGRYYLTPKISSFVIEGFLGTIADKNNASGLSSREKSILQMMAEGLSSKEIAEKLELSLHTVHAHRNNIMNKLKMHRQADLIRFAIKEGMVQI
jgi:two-component system, NarL family, response regulator NreC